MLDICIIDPTSTEFNRGSFCYLPYIVYSSLKKKKKIKIIENFTVDKIDNVPSAKEYWISLWSYPQIESCYVINKFLDGNIKFFGYYPLIDYLNLPKVEISEECILNGITEYPNTYTDFKFILLSDCDMHLSKYSGIVYPLFTSYGCPKHCSFCPSSVNCKHHRIEAKVDTVISTLAACRDRGVKNIHFTDEDFFYNIDRTHEILMSQANKGMRFIALGSVQKVLQYIDSFGVDSLHKSGIKLIEVGFETADASIAKAMKKNMVSKYIELAERTKDKIDILWLTLTFFPGETVKSLRKTGDFLQSYGFDIYDLKKRIATNGTRGGLGQFFQLYHGINNYNEIKNKGILLTERPLRLLPSYIPHSFLNSHFEVIRTPQNTDKKWFDLYKISPTRLNPRPGQTYTVKNIAKNADDFIHIAVSARLGIIK